jgi:hypothetical protein
MPHLDSVYTCIFCGCAGHLVKFCFRHKIMEKRCVDYATNSSQNEFIDFLPRISSHTPSRALSRTSSHTLSHFSHVPNNHLCGFGSRENHFVPRRFGYEPHPHRGDHFSHMPGFPNGGSYIHLEPRHLDGLYFPHRSRPTRSSGEVLKTMKTSSDHMIKCWIPKIYLTNPALSHRHFLILCR